MYNKLIKICFHTDSRHFDNFIATDIISIFEMINILANMLGKKMYYNVHNRPIQSNTLKVRYNVFTIDTCQSRTQSQANFHIVKMSIDGTKCTMKKKSNQSTQLSHKYFYLNEKENNISTCLFYSSILFLAI